MAPMTMATAASTDVAPARIRSRRVPLRAVWGGHYEIFGPYGALALRRDLPDAVIHMVPTGLFALETNAALLAALASDFLGRRATADDRQSDHPHD